MSYYKKPLLKRIRDRVRRFTYTVTGSFLDFVFGDERRRWIVGFGPQKIAPGKTETIQVMPHCRFRGEKILNTGDSSGLFVAALTVGQNAQLPTYSNPISLSAFGTGVLDNELVMDDCSPNHYISFTIQNCTNEEKTFAASIIGAARLERTIQDEVA